MLPLTLLGVPASGGVVPVVTPQALLSSTPTTDGRRFMLAELPVGTLTLLALTAAVVGLSRSELLADVLAHYLGVRCA